MMIGILAKQKLSELKAGIAPDGLMFVLNTPNKIILGHNGEKEFMEGIELNSLHASITYDNTEIIINYDKPKK